MKKFLVLALILVAATFAAFADGEGISVEGPKGIELNFSLKGVFNPKFSFGGEISEKYIISEQGTVTDAETKKSVTIIFYDCSYFNRKSKSGVMTVSLAIGDLILLEGNKQKENPDHGEYTTFDCYLTTVEGKNVTKKDNGFKCEYEAGTIVNRTEGAQVGTIELAWDYKGLVEGEYRANITVITTAE